jgi:hypothetical protein
MRRGSLAVLDPQADRVERGQRAHMTLNRPGLPGFRGLFVEQVYVVEAHVILNRPRCMVNMGCSYRRLSCWPATTWMSRLPLP